MCLHIILVDIPLGYLLSWLITLVPQQASTRVDQCSPVKFA